jgi:cellulose synthase/poly-beta-1,6-N-acetylglucosamine synthase-like glycosyltransferase
MAFLHKGGKLTPQGVDLLQVILSFLLVYGLPMGIYRLIAISGFDITYTVYVTTVIFLAVMAVFILTECIAASFHKGAPKEPGSPPVAASAIICAYLPNEAATIMETINHFLALEYEPGIQIIMAYNTSIPVAVEEELRDLANLHPNLLVLKIENSHSKAQNLNAALDFVIGDFVGVFDADHWPDPDSYSRAWRWLSNGYDVVQGHCLSRNPEESWMARMVAIEFETIYALAHPGRTSRDGFGVFGGSNGYWKTPLLQRIGIRSSMLTEDIDSSMRVLEEGGRIATDPLLVSRELATTTILHTWNQRLRWA